MSVELLKLTSASLSSSGKPVPRICKPTASTLPVQKFDNAIFSPLPTNEAAEGTCVKCQNDFAAQEPPLFSQPPTDPSFSPITVKASDNFALFGTPTTLSPASSHEGVSTEGQSSVRSILSSNTSTPNSIQVKILSSKLKEIPSPHGKTNRDKCNSPSDACLQTPPRALGIPTSKKNYENHGGLHLKPNSRSTKPVKKVLSQGVMSTGLVGLDESSQDDSIVVVNLNNTGQSSIKDKLCQKKGNSFHKQVVYPNVVQHKGEDNGFTKEAKGIQTESFPEKFDEGTQCEEERVVVHTRGIQTSPNSSIGKKTQHPVQNLPPAVTPLMQSTAPQLTDAVTLIASTAAAAAVAASASLHNNDKHSKETCLNGRNGSRDSQKDMSTNTRTGSVHTATQTVRTDHWSDLGKPRTTDKTKLETSPQTNHNKVDSQINKKAQATFDPGSVERDSHWLRRSELLKQKYEKSSVDGVVEVLHSAAVAQEEIEHQCAALESTPTLTEFTEAMIKGRAIQERIRVHQSINKLIEQAKAKENQLTPELNPKDPGTSLKPEGGGNLRTRQATKSKVAKIRKRKADCHIANYRRHVYGSKFDYRADGERTSPKAEFVVNPLRHDIGCQMNSANPTAISLGPPRQSKSHHSIPTASVANTFKSVACQAPSSTPTPVKHTREEFVKEKPDTSTGSIKLASPVNIGSSNGMMEATVLSSGKPSPIAAPTRHDDVPRADDFQQVLDICSYSSINNSGVAFEDNKETEGTAITVEGEEVQRAADYQGPSFPPKPAKRLSPYNVEPLSMSASELDRKLRENLEQKAMEWIHQELLVRLAAEKSQDPVGHMVNTCSTCSINSATEDLPGMHKLPGDEEDECVKVLVYEEVLGLIKKVLKERSCRKEKESPKESTVSEVDDASLTASALCHLLTPAVTPPSTPTNLRSTTSSPDHVALVTTPLPTPPQSPTPSIGQLVEISSVKSEISGVSTPKSSSSSTSNDGIDDSLMHNIQPEVVNSNLSSPSTTQPTITTSPHTPEASRESANQKPQTEEAVTRHTIDPTATSTESSSTTSSSPAVSDATSTTTTTDHDISMGEYILAKPTVVQRTKKADYSLSEGEVPLSPGDARWNTLHASKLTGNLKEKKKKDITRPNHPVIEAFLDLKQAISCEKDSDSATEFSADSLQFKPQVSNGELQVGSRDPFKKLLDKLNSSISSSDSTTAGGDEEKENTLSEVASFATQEDITTTISSPSSSAVTDDIRNGTSPGEIARNISVLPVPPGEEPSLGEVSNSQKMAKISRSPGEVPPILRASETRHGIDVIRISKWSDKPPLNDNIQQPSVAITSESQYLMEQFNSSEIIQMSTSQSSMSTQGCSNGSSQLQSVASHTNANDGPTESQVLLSSPTKSHTVEGEVNRKVVTINIPDATAGFYSEDITSSSSNNKELGTEMTFTISSLSSENF